MGLHVNEALWAYRTNFKVTMQFTPFQLIYTMEAIIAIELEIPSLQVALLHETGNTNAIETQLMKLEHLDESQRLALYNNIVM